VWPSARRARASARETRAASSTRGRAGELGPEPTPQATLLSVSVQNGSDDPSDSERCSRRWRGSPRRWRGARFDTRPTPATALMSTVRHGHPAIRAAPPHCIALVNSSTSPEHARETRCPTARRLRDRCRGSPDCLPAGLKRMRLQSHGESRCSDSRPSECGQLTRSSWRSGRSHPGSCQSYRCRGHRCSLPDTGSGERWHTGRCSHRTTRSAGLNRFRRWSP
jgi:hypothetical protein